MTYTSYGFLLFTAAALLCYYLVPRRARIGVLLSASVLFLFFADGMRSVFFVTGSGVLSFFAARAMERREGRRRTLLYGAACFLQLAVLVYFKYLNFPAYTRLAFSELTGGTFSFEPFAPAAPIGISFYTLMQLSYLTDVWRSSYAAASSAAEYGLYTSFFPYIVQGPIERFDHLKEQLAGDRRFSSEDFMGGLFRLSWGLFKKLVISERLAVFVNTIYGDPAYYSGSYLIFAAVCFSFQLYTDFSGCIDLVAGTAELFGIRFPENFKQPFFSRSDAEFWRRWHITLGNWFKDYLIYPLLRTKFFLRIGKWSKKVFGKKYGKKIPASLSLLPVWFLLGLWHGGMWTFIIGSGLWHCLCMILAQLFEPCFRLFYQKSGLSPENRAWRVFQSLRTFVIVSIGFVFFRADSLSMALSVFGGMLRGSGEAAGLFSAEGFLALGMGLPDAAVLFASMLLLFFVSLRLERTEVVTAVGAQAETESFANRMAGSFYGKTAWTVGLVLITLIFGYYGPGYDASAFIYSQF